MTGGQEQHLLSEQPVAWWTVKEHWGVNYFIVGGSQGGSGSLPTESISTFGGAFGGSVATHESMKSLRAM